MAVDTFSTVTLTQDDQPALPHPSLTSNQCAQEAPVTRPDGDIEVQNAGQGFMVPHCQACGSGILKPDVVFFGAFSVSRIAASDRASHTASSL